MKFLLFICVDPELPFDEKPGEIDGWVDLAGAARRDGGPLRGPRSAATIRVRGGKASWTNGPFAETREFIAGFDLIDCATREEALEIAAAHPVARFGAIEVRELVDD